MVDGEQIDDETLGNLSLHLDFLAYSAIEFEKAFGPDAAENRWAMVSELESILLDAGIHPQLVELDVHLASRH